MIASGNIQKTFSSSNARPLSLKLSKYSLLAHVYFFFNSFLLPKGLLYTTILSPYLFYRQLESGRATWWRGVALVMGFYFAAHLYLGVHLQSFLVSNILFVFTYFTVIAFYHFINGYPHLGRIFRQLVVLNFFLALAAIPFLFMERQSLEVLWWVNKLTKGVNNFPRLKLFTYEASYYALLMVPVFYYYWFKLFFGKLQHNRFVTMFMVTLPMLMALSFGVIGTMLLTAFVMCLIFWKQLLGYRKPFLIITGSLLALVAGTLLAWAFFPGNPVFLRIANILQGSDTSANGRVIESFTVAWQLAEDRSVFTGIGLGQIKILIVELARTRYNYWGNLERFDIPNAMGETLAIFGLLGVALRLFLEWYLFFRTKVYTNYYRLSLFIFVFIYQFTGSYITNIVEYVLWIFAFSQVFEQFTIKNRRLA